MKKEYYKWTEDKLKILYELYATTSNDDLGKILGISNRRTIAEYARKRGLKKEIDPSRKGTLKPLLEENNESFYWLGFIMADGWISKYGQLVIALSNKDENHLQIIAELLKTNINNYPSSNKKGIQSRISVQDKNYGVELRNKMNIRDKKTYEIPNLNFVPDEFMLPFIIGFIDGDGSLINSNIKIECWKNWAESFDYFGKYFKDKYNIEYRISFSKDKYVSIYFGRRESELIKREMLKLNVPYLKRKWDLINN